MYNVVLFCFMLVDIFMCRGYIGSTSSLKACMQTGAKGSYSRIMSFNKDLNVFDTFVKV